MSIDPTIRKIFPGVATHEQMFVLMNQPPDGPMEDRVSGKAWAGRWFEILRQSYEEMFDLMPLRFFTAGTFAISELKAGSVGSVFFEIMIDGRRRWFHGYCNLGDHPSPEEMRAAIIEHEKAAVANLTREEKLDLIWSLTHDDFRGIAGALNPNARPVEHRGKRSILVYEPGVGTVLKLLENLTADEIADKLPHGPTI